MKTTINFITKLCLFFFGNNAYKIKNTYLVLLLLLLLFINGCIMYILNNIDMIIQPKNKYIDMISNFYVFINIYIYIYRYTYTYTYTYAYLKMDPSRAG